MRLLLRPLLLLAALVWVPFALLAAFDLDFWWLFASLLAFLPYAAVFTALVAVVCMLVKARMIALVALVGLAVLLVPRAGRVTSNDQPTATGSRLVVATSNVRFGKANASELVRLMRTERVDVLAIQEDTPDITDDLATAGLRTRFSYAVLGDAPGARGISLYSRYPIQAVAPRPGDTRSIGGIVELPSGDRIAVRCVHPPPPFSAPNLTKWKNRIADFPAARASGGTILAGDFNATLDHHPLRRLLDRGYRDASDESGIAWHPTWTNSSWATLTLDHVLVPAGVAVRGVRIHDLAGSDHDVVVSTLRLRG